VICACCWNHIGTDEGVLTEQAARQTLHVRPICGQPWPLLFGTLNSGLTNQCG
jgi:hypothetical protein